MKHFFHTVLLVGLIVIGAGCLQLIANAKKTDKQGPRIDVTTDSDPAVKDAEIWLDGEAKGKAPLAVTTTTGRHLVEIKKPGVVTFSQWVTIKSDEETIMISPQLVASGNGLPGAARVIPNHWKYDATSSDAPPATRVVWEGGAEDFGGAQAFFLESVSISRDGTSRLDERDYYQKATDGLYRLGVRGDLQSSDAVSSTHSITDSSFAVPQRMLPVPFEIGASWSVQVNQTLVTKTAVSGMQPRRLPGKSTSSITGELAVSGREQVTVPAGVFECLVVRGKTVERTVQREGELAGNATFTTTTVVAWYAPRVGLVQSELTSDVESIIKGKSTKQRRTATMRLKQHRVERASFEMDAIGFVDDLPPVRLTPPATDPTPTEPPAAVPTAPLSEAPAVP